MGGPIRDDFNYPFILGEAYLLLLIIAFTA